MSTGTLILALLWALPASVGVFMTYREQRNAGQAWLWSWGTLGGILICLLWPITAPVILLILLLHKHVLIVLNGTAEGTADDKARRP